ncbi:alpha/beta fold hydrolase [Actinospica robiniae]|uniref:Putative hydrolase or acyltransferase of alpha/beta superfamily n=1 Tax=Actinospica robiniae DSM 44927 TaxID=479430 RepID=W9DWB0_9ACTN|nr:alpha/beta fold hydrolase [Actinospica robiniae]ETA71109.1 putative hydrolase or acyltransferase of alpha/beta superfamily [Actinospica robiniae DSM 44927]
MPVSALPKPTLARTVRGIGPGLVLAHGAGGSIADNYGPILDGLAAGHTVVGVDWPGTGGSPRSDAPLDADELADQLIAAADAEGLDSFALAGFSLGGPVAIRAAARHPGRISALILTATFAYRDARLDLAAQVWADLYASKNTELLARFLSLVAFSTDALRATDPEALAAGIKALAEAIPPGTPEHVDLVRRIDVREDLARITAPTLVISTSADPLLSPHLHRELAQQIPGARMAELATGHLPFAEKPEQWLALMTDFLAAPESRA